MRLKSFLFTATMAAAAVITPLGCTSKDAAPAATAAATAAAPKPPAMEMAPDVVFSAREWKIVRATHVEGVPAVIIARAGFGDVVGGVVRLRDALDLREAAKDTFREFVDGNALVGSPVILDSVCVSHGWVFADGEGTQLGEYAVAMSRVQPMTAIVVIASWPEGALSAEEDAAVRSEIRAITVLSEAKLVPVVADEEPEGDDPERAAPLPAALGNTSI